MPPCRYLWTSYLFPGVKLPHRKTPPPVNDVSLRFEGTSSVSATASPGAGRSADRCPLLPRERRHDSSGGWVPRLLLLVLHPETQETWVGSQHRSPPPLIMSTLILVSRWQHRFNRSYFWHVSEQMKQLPWKKTRTLAEAGNSEPQDRTGNHLISARW